MLYTKEMKIDAISLFKEGSRNTGIQQIKTSK